jgi:hypothetical protein
MHAPPQSMVPAGHAQAPSTQEPPEGQALQSSPQAAASVMPSTQTPEQRVSPDEHSSSPEQPTRIATEARRAGRSRRGAADILAAYRSGDEK